MRDLAVDDRPAGSVKAKIGDVVLPARIETAADFDVEILHGLVEVEKLSCQPCSDFSGKTARRGDAQLAGVCAGARRDIDNRAGAGLTQSDPL